MPSFKAASVHILKDEETVHSLSEITGDGLPTMSEPSLSTLAASRVSLAKNIQDFLALEDVYHGQISENFERLDSHISVLAFLVGGKPPKSYDADLVRDLKSLSGSMMHLAQSGRDLKWMVDNDRTRIRFQKFKYEVERVFTELGREFPGSEEAIERSLSFLNLVNQRIRLYQKISSISADSPYWDLQPNVKNKIDQFYDQEILYAQFLELELTTLEKLCFLGILDESTKNQGSRVYGLLGEASKETRTGILFDPNTYGLNHRVVELSDVYDKYSSYITTVLERVTYFRDCSATNFYRNRGDLTYGQVDILIDELKQDLTKPIQRLVDFQHLLESFDTCPQIDSNQVLLGRYTVNGIIRDMYVKHVYELPLRTDI